MRSDTQVLMLFAVNLKILCPLLVIIPFIAAQFSITWQLYACNTAFIHKLFENAGSSSRKRVNSLLSVMLNLAELIEYFRDLIV